jgi:hypothetical protein
MSRTPGTQATQISDSVIIIEAKLLLLTVVEANTDLKRRLGIVHMYGCGFCFR